MRNDLIVSQSITVNANIDIVWKSLTTPEIIKEYLYGTETVTDWKPGSEIVFQGEYQGHKYRDKGVILTNILNQEISYSYWSGFSGLEEKPENYSTVTYSLKLVDDKTTEFTWTQKGFANEEGYNHSKNGMTDFLEGIKKVMEKS
jgi:uncharacterized protein YndB with AHSA1/START domain